MEGAWDRDWTSEASSLDSRQMQVVYLFSKMFRAGREAHKLTSDYCRGTEQVELRV
jgi:hypothetical protein